MRLDAGGLSAAALALALGIGCRNSNENPPPREATSVVAPSAPAWISAPAGAAGAPAVAPADAPPAKPGEEPACITENTKPAGKEIALRLTPSRTSGVAPLAVYFETRGTTASSTDRPFHELTYAWDFGDPASGVFRTTGRRKGSAWGPAAGHVFEKPGTYRVTLVARDSASRITRASTTITVSDPAQVFAGGATVCLSGSGTFIGCPAGATHVTGSGLSALDKHVAQGRRLLLRRGETFTGRLHVNARGPGIIGAFGPESAPKPRVTPSEAAFVFSSGEAPLLDDWRLMDVDAEGQGDRSELAYVGGTSKNLLMLRVSGRRLGHGIRAPEAILNYHRAKSKVNHDATDVLAIVDSDIRQIIGGDGHGLLGIAAHRLMLLGNVFADTLQAEHVLRAFWIDRGVLRGNEFSDAPEPRHLVKLHAPHFGRSGVGMGKHSEDIVLSENVFRGTGGHAWSVAIGPQNAQSDERVRNVILERNLFLSGPKVRVALILWGQDITVRNNLFNGGAADACVAGGRRGIEPGSDRITLLENSCYLEGKNPKLGGFDGTATNVATYNNLLLGPHAKETAPGDVAAQGGNIATQKPVFSASPPDRPEAFRLLPSSVAVDAGLAQRSTPCDFAETSRPRDGDGSGRAEPDVGAWERQ